MLVLEPRKLDERLIKLHQQNKRLLMENEVLNIDHLLINNVWDFYLDAKLIKCKKIIGSVYLHLNHIPSWMRYIEIDGSFYCNNCNLTTLKNCPKIIHSTFNCKYNNLTSLEDSPTFVGGNYYCYDNIIKFSHQYVTSICNVNNIIYV